MTIELIAEMALGTAEIPESEPAEAVVVVIDIEPNMSTDDYDVTVIRPATLPPEDVVVTGQTTSEVELTVTRPDGFAGTPGITVHALCIKRDDDEDSGWVNVSAFLDAGWTGTARIRKVFSVVYLQILVTAAASIDGTPKTDAVTVLTGLDSVYAPENFSTSGFNVDETQQLLSVLPQPDGSVVVAGVSGTTGDWTDGVSALEGQVSWIAGS